MHSRFDKVFRGVTLLVALWGLTAIALTGQYPYYVIATVAAALLLGWRYQSLSKRIPNFAWTVITLAAFALAIFFASVGSFVDSVVYFVFYLIVVKFFHPQTYRDYLQIYIISFFLILASSVLTASIVFVITFLGYLVLITLALMLLTVKREREWLGLRVGEGRGALFVAQDWRGTNADQLVTPRFLLGSGWMTCLILVLTMTLFLVFPRFSSRNFFYGFGKMKQKNLSGFEESVEFGALEEIHLDPSIVLRAKVEWTENSARPLPDYLRLRGVALDSYNGRTWSRSNATGRYERGMVKEGDVVLVSQPDFRSKSLLKQDIYLEPGYTNYLFAASMPTRFTFNFEPQLLVNNELNSVQIVQKPNDTLYYQASSALEGTRLDLDQELPKLREQRRKSYGSPSARYEREAMSRLEQRSEQGPIKGALVEAGETIISPFSRLMPGASQSREADQAVIQRRFTPNLQDLKRVYLQLPQRDPGVPRYKELAASIAQGRTTPFQIANAVERYLQVNYEYTTTGGINSGGERHLEEFLFEQKRGHCEYFATSMVILLRCLGIPSRLVNGFYSTEWNQYGRYFTVRESDAHSWVEVWFDDYGWMTFDPTPPAVMTRSQEETSLFYHLNQWVDSMKLNWYKYVIDFSLSDQADLFMWMRRASRGPRTTIWNMASAAWGVWEQFTAMFSARSSASANKKMLLMIGTGFVLSVLAFMTLLAGLRALRRTGRRKGLAYRKRQRRFLETLYLKIL
ncbi:MAG: DUF3488 and transglutaminase-like domain-containing protein, partial [bacterium]